MGESSERLVSAAAPATRITLSLQPAPPRSKRRATAYEDTSMSHHYSGPDFGFPLGDPRLDFTDLYAFPKPGDAEKSILIMNVHPSATENPPGATTIEPFASEAIYELKI